MPAEPQRYKLLQALDMRTLNFKSGGAERPGARDDWSGGNPNPNPNPKPKPKPNPNPSPNPNPNPNPRHGARRHGLARPLARPAAVRWPTRTRTLTLTLTLTRTLTLTLTLT